MFKNNTLYINYIIILFDTYYMNIIILIILIPENLFINQITISKYYERRKVFHQGFFVILRHGYV